jgi:hypothetical protein
VSSHRPFERRLGRTYQQAVCARAVVENMPELAAAARERLVQIDREIASEGDGANMAELARRLSLGPKHVELARELRHNIAERLGGLATRQTWDDLVIPA